MISTRSTTKQYIAVDGHNIAYITAGDPAAPPLVMVHGWLSHSGVWRTTFEAFQNTHFCVAIDLLGLADSDKPADGDYSILAQAKRVLALADALGLGRFTVIGHSMGGQTALCLASMLAPDRVDKLIDVDGVTTGQLCWYPRNVTLRRLGLAVNSPWMWDLSRWLDQYAPVIRFEFSTWFYHMPPLESWAVDRQIAMQPGMHISAYRCGQAILAMNLREHLHKITAPTLVMFGKQDRVVPISEGLVVKEHVLNGELVWLEECGHFPMLEKPSQYIEALKKFLP